MPLRASTSPAWRQHLPFSFATTFHHVPCDIEYDSSAERDSFLLWHRAFPTPALVGIPNDRKLSWSKSFKMNWPICWLSRGNRKNHDLRLKLCPAVERLYFGVCITTKKIVLRGSASSTVEHAAVNRDLQIQ